MGEIYILNILYYLHIKRVKALASEESVVPCRWLGKNKLTSQSFYGGKLTLNHLDGIFSHVNATLIYRSSHVFHESFFKGWFIPLKMLCCLAPVRPQSRNPLSHPLVFFTAHLMQYFPNIFSDTRSSLWLQEKYSINDRHASNKKLHNSTILLVQKEKLSCCTRCTQ